MTQSCDSLPKLGELTCDRFFSMTCHQMPFDLFLGISLGLLLEFKPVLKSVVKNAYTLQRLLNLRTPVYLNCSPRSAKCFVL